MFVAEIFQYDLCEDDKFMVLASDGVWEFLRNDEVVDLVVPFWHKNDLRGACNVLIKQSVAAWEREEDSIDDITCIVVFFKRKETQSFNLATQLAMKDVNTRQGTRENSQNRDL